MQLFNKAFHGREARLKLSILGLHPIDVGVEGFDLSRGDVGAREIIKGRPKRTHIMLQYGQCAIDNRQSVELGAYRRQLVAQAFERQIGHRPVSIYPAIAGRPPRTADMAGVGDFLKRIAGSIARDALEASGTAVAL
jgi:hypothetical protein